MSLSDRFIRAFTEDEAEPQTDESQEQILAEGNDRFKLLSNASQATVGPHVVMAYHSGGVHIWNGCDDAEGLPYLEAMTEALAYYVAAHTADIRGEEAAFAFVGRLADAALGG